jgi:hypothetical protein
MACSGTALALAVLHNVPIFLKEAFPDILSKRAYQVST